MSAQTIIPGSCLILDLPFDVMITDPPYSDHVHSNAVSQSPGRGVRERQLGFDALTDDLRQYIAKCAAKAKRWSIIYSDIEGLHGWRLACIEAGATYIRPIPWVRWSMPQLSGDRPPTGCEFVSCFWGTQKGRKSWNGPGNLTHLAHKALRGEGKHKTEKPLDQALDLVSYFSNEGETVYDPCAGSGVFGLACKILNRNYIGVEIDPEWVEKAEARIRNPLGERDLERYSRWLETQKLEEENKAKRKKNTAKVRAKADAASRANGSDDPVLDGSDGGELLGR